jgi:hypothetical protein
MARLPFPEPKKAVVKLQDVHGLKPPRVVGSERFVRGPVMSRMALADLAESKGSKWRFSQAREFSQATARWSIRDEAYALVHKSEWKKTQYKTLWAVANTTTPKHDLKTSASGRQ